MENICAKVYAKINIALDILGSYSDGYHKLDMLMTSVDIADVICVSKASASRVIMDGKMCGKENTASKAVALLQEEFGIELRVEIVKGIPMSAGLGGSSADASGVFACAQMLFDLPKDVVTKLANKVGSDVAYMMSGGACRVGGRGEIVQRVDLPNFALVIAQKEVGASTRDVYQRYDKNLIEKLKEENDIVAKEKNKLKCENIFVENGKSELNDESDILANSKNASVENSQESQSTKIDSALASVSKNCKGAFNVLQESAIELCPSIETTLRDMQKYAKTAFMTGSGSAVVGVFDNMTAAESCARKLKGYAFVKAVTTLDKGLAIIEES
ncbi:MAG: 4-(cytidine 5'-diphospho)-2-C-methyl-D-erythritol kinase [Clostridia bacterium]